MLGEWKVIIVPQIYRVMVLVQPEQLFRFFKHKTPNKTLSTEFLTLAPQMPHTLRSMGQRVSLGTWDNVRSFRLKRYQTARRPARNKHVGLQNVPS